MKTLAVESLIAASTPLQVAPNAVDVWAWSLSGTETSRQWCFQQLVDAERARAARFVFQRDRDYHVFAHGVLRHLLSRYTGIPPTELQFTTGPAGKPALASGSLTFSLAHSGGRGLLAISTGRHLGIDLEQIRPDVETLAIARRYFFGNERQTIESASPENQHATFFRYWTAKEAVLKAQGVGLGFPLDQFHVEFDATATRARVQTFDAARLAPHWNVQTLPMEEGWKGAVATSGEDWQVTLRDDTHSP